MPTDRNDPTDEKILNYLFVLIDCFLCDLVSSWPKYMYIQASKSLKSNQDF